jgi:predicted NACHT family NTPase
MSRRVAPEFLDKVKQAMKRLFGSEQRLAEEIPCSRSTVSNFVGGRPVREDNFDAISEKLRFDPEEIAYRDEKPNIGEINALVKKVRNHCCDKIQNLCGTMRMLDIAQPVNINNLYVDVNILEGITSKQLLDLSDLVKDFNPYTDNFDRLGLGKVRQTRVRGMDAVTANSKLMLLGKPGAGKTTFLKHLAIQCNQGKFQAERIPIFISLKFFAEEALYTDDLSILDYIKEEFVSFDSVDLSVLKKVLSEGKALILLDGLDEVPDKDCDEVVKQIRWLTRKYYKNQFIVTCRIAASKYRFQQEGFTDVEVADFNDEQIAAFANNWFVAFSKENQAEGEAKASEFIEKLKLPENQQIRELAVTPILLNLACLVFSYKAKFPSKRSKLYEQGLDILLRIWDEERYIKRGEVYQNLNLQRKKQLLFYLAAITFERGDYFFEQDKSKQLIAGYLSTLPNAITDRAILEEDSQAVLKAIEAQHGLLVERAQGIYSFSHLTFQEYFTARYFVESPGLQALENLSNHITEKRWREVFLLTIDMLPNAEG